MQYVTVEDMKRGVTHKEHFSVWLGEYDEANWYPEVRKLRQVGFDTVKYACEVLKRTIQWEIRSKYDNEEDEEDWMIPMGSTQIVPQRTPNKPFTIRITISAEYIWPLLVPDYSTAEKAACSFSLAATMLHELAVSKPKTDPPPPPTPGKALEQTTNLHLTRQHAITFARQQLFHPSSSWLRLNPQWKATPELTPDVINSLVTFGRRFLLDKNYLNSVISYPAMQDYFEAERVAEEGFAAENQVRHNTNPPCTAQAKTLGNPPSLQTS